MNRLIAGCMTGTSCDGLDACLVEISGVWPQMRAGVLKLLSRDLGDLGRRLHRLSLGEPAPAATWSQAALELGLLHADLLAELCSGAPVQLIVLHGQTVHHAPPASWQLINPHPVVRKLGIEVLFDLRGADLAAGGQGAPITPLADAVLFADATPTTVVNLGGFINYTFLPADPQQAMPLIRAADLCAGNQILDAVARLGWSEAFDPDGRHATAGGVNDAACAELASRLAGQGRQARSLGSGDELNDWVRDQLRHISPEDLAATCCRAIGGVVAGLGSAGGALILAGGGTRNARLVDEIRRQSKGPVRLSSELGIDPMAREAAAMAVLGALCQDGVAVTLPQVTGCPAPAPVAGCRIHP